MKGTGQTPISLAPQLSSVVETGRLYMQDVRNQQLLTLAAIGNGYVNAVTVPAGELWIVERMSIGISCGVGVSASIAGAYQGLNATWQVAVGAYIAVPASTNIVIPCGDAAGLILPPGFQAGIYAHTVTGVPTGAVRLDYYRLSI